jgi:hypothetical protein
MMGAVGMRLLTALLVLLGSAAATNRHNEALSVAQGLVSASQAFEQGAYASLNEHIDLELSEEDKRCVCVIVITPWRVETKNWSQPGFFRFCLNFIKTSYYHVCEL